MRWTAVAGGKAWGRGKCGHQCLCVMGGGGRGGWSTVYAITHLLPLCIWVHLSLRLIGVKSFWMNDDRSTWKCTLPYSKLCHLALFFHTVVKWKFLVYLLWRLICFCLIYWIYCVIHALYMYKSVLCAGISACSVRFKIHNSICSFWDFLFLPPTHTGRWAEGAVIVWPDYIHYGYIAYADTCRN